MMMEPIQYIYGLVSGGFVGFFLSLVGGGGSILAVPLMVYLVGVNSPHTAIGTSALAVAVNAMMGLSNHARLGNVKWRCGFLYAGAGIIGAFGGSTLGKAVDGQKLLALFAILMIVVGIIMMKGRKEKGIEGAACNRENAPKVLSFGLGTGMFSGFFGIGGGFLIVPGLIRSTSMPMINAVGTSLVAVTAFGLTTAANYAFSDLIDWTLAIIFIIGGFLGGLLGARAARYLSNSGKLTIVFAMLIFIVAGYMLWQSVNSIW